MKDNQNLLAKLQEYIDCFLEADPREEFREITAKGIAGDATGDLTELALKYLALAIIHGVEENARAIAVIHNGDMDGAVVMKTTEEMRLPDPPSGLARQMADLIRCIAGLEETTGAAEIACGFREDRLALRVETDMVGAMKKIILFFPTIKAMR